MPHAESFGNSRPPSRNSEEDLSDFEDVSSLHSHGAQLDAGDHDMRTEAARPHRLNVDDSLQPSNNSTISGAPPSAKSSMLLGTAAIVICIFSFLGQTIVTRKVQESYVHPYFILWTAHSFWIVLLPLHTVYEKLKRSSRSLSTLKDEILVGCARLIEQRRRNTDNYQHIHDGETCNADSTANIATTDSNNNGNCSEGGNRNDSRSSSSNNSSDPNSTSVNRANDAIAAFQLSAIDTPATYASLANDAPKTSLDDASCNVGSEPSAGNSISSSLAFAVHHPWYVVLRAFILATILSGLLNTSAYLWYAALNFSSMSKVTAIYNMSCFFAYVFSIILLKDRIRISKCIAVGISIIGVAIMALIDTDPDSNISSKSPDHLPMKSARSTELFGDLISLCCACGIGLYQVLYKKYAVPTNFHSLFHVNFMTAMIGLSTLCLFWIPIPVLHFVHVERFQWPDAIQLRYIIANALFGVAYNGGFMIALALTSPLFAAIGVMLTIPAAAVVDMFMHGEILAWNVFLGGFGILVGFSILTYSEYNDTINCDTSEDVTNSDSSD